MFQLRPPVTVLPGRSILRVTTRLFALLPNFDQKKCRREPDKTVQVFVCVRDFGETREAFGDSNLDKKEAEGVFLAASEADRNSSAKRAPVGAQLQ